MSMELASSGQRPLSLFLSLFLSVPLFVHSFISQVLLQAITPKAGLYVHEGPKYLLGMDGT